MITPYVLTEIETLDYLSRGYSIARYGDGEFNLCTGGRAKLEAHDTGLAADLRMILQSYNRKCVVGIPRFESLTEEKKAFWQKYKDEKFNDLYRENKVYASSFVTRPDNAPSINNHCYWHRVKQLWDGKNVVLVEGNDPVFAFNKGGLLDNADRIKTIKAPSHNAYGHFKLILDKCKAESPDLFILSLGATATVLAYSLTLYGHQALDLGHMGFLYEKCYLRGLKH